MWSSRGTDLRTANVVKVSVGCPRELNFVTWYQEWGASIGVMSSSNAEFCLEQNFPPFTIIHLKALLCRKDRDGQEPGDSYSAPGRGS